MIYLIGSLRNPEIPKLAAVLRERGHEVFDDWAAAHPDADDKWQAYEQARGRTYREALRGKTAQTIFNFDKTHLDQAEAAVLVAPAGKSAHLELGYMIGRGKKGYILLDNPDRWDVMYQFATEIFDTQEGLIDELEHLLSGTVERSGPCQPWWSPFGEGGL